MTRLTSFARTAAALRELDPAATTTLTPNEDQRAHATLSRILATPAEQHVRTTSPGPRRRRALLLVPASLLAATAIVVPLALTHEAAFASWSPTPAPLTRSTAADAATTCRSALDIDDPQSRVAIGERRGGWTYVLLEGPQGEGACVMPDDLIGSRDKPGRKSGFFGSYDSEPAESPTPAQDDIVETESTSGTVALAGHASLGTVEGWLTWTSGYAGRDVTGIIVHPPVGPAVKASLTGGRFSAWWPSGKPSSHNLGAMGAWTYTLTLTDGTTRHVQIGG